MLPYNRSLTDNARELRKNMTPEEKHLWYDLLKRLPLNVHRQHNLLNYIVDFYIAEKKIVIEVDGRQHSSKENQIDDAKRDDALAALGIKVLRYPNDRIRDNFNVVANDILEKLGLTFSDLVPIRISCKPTL